MALTDPLGDMLTRIRNAQLRKKSKVDCPASKLRGHVLDVLVEEGYLRSYAQVERDGRPAFEIELKYYNGQPVIKEISRISKPGRRVYAAIDDVPNVANGLGISILSTSQGVMSDARAREAKIGGEVLCSVF